MGYYSLLEKDKVPDFLIRAGIRRLLRRRLLEEKKGNTELQQEHLTNLIEELKKSPIAVNTKEANEQHYEVPAQFYKYCLGRHLKYSSGYWKQESGIAGKHRAFGKQRVSNEPVFGKLSLSKPVAFDKPSDLDKAEETMLALTCERAELREGQDVLELGCGWGSLSLYMAARYKESRFTVVSNSHSQKQYIDEQTLERGVTNLTVLTADMNEFNLDKKFDRVVSVEMFEHMRNYQKLMAKVFGLLKADGKLFVHIFTHKTCAYKFEVRDETDWMSRYFFTGGIMPSDHLLLYFDEHMGIERHWQVSGLHYSRTAEAWLRNMDAHRSAILPLFGQTYGEKNALKWWVYWRVFFMACSELWKYHGGEEWIVSHYLFKKR